LLLIVEPAFFESKLFSANEDERMLHNETLKFAHKLLRTATSNMLDVHNLALLLDSS